MAQQGNQKEQEKIANTQKPNYVSIANNEHITCWHAHTHTHIDAYFCLRVCECVAALEDKQWNNSRKIVT